MCLSFLIWKVGLWEAGSHIRCQHCGSMPVPGESHPHDLCPTSPPRFLNLERRLRPSRSALACWSTHRPQGSPRWKPVPTASLMNCDVTEPSSPTTARFPPSSISVLAVRAQPGIWGAGGAARDHGEELVSKMGMGSRGWATGEACGSGEAPRPDSGRPEPARTPCDLC